MIQLYGRGYGDSQRSETRWRIFRTRPDRRGNWLRAFVQSEGRVEMMVSTHD